VVHVIGALCTDVFACNLALCASAVSLVSFNRSTAAVPVAQTEVQATGTAAVPPRVTGTSDTADRHKNYAKFKIA